MDRVSYINYSALAIGPSLGPCSWSFLPPEVNQFYAEASGLFDRARGALFPDAQKSEAQHRYWALGNTPYAIRHTPYAMHTPYAIRPRQ